MGKRVNKFEDDFAKYIGTDYAVSANSGSSALLLTFYSLKIKASDKVIAPSATIIATFNGSTALGAIPVFCEIGHDYMFSSRALENILNKNEAKYIIPVHLYGHPCNMDAINHIVDNKNITIIEDAAQTHGAKYKGKKSRWFWRSIDF